MISLSEIETTTKRATKAIGFPWGIAEDMGKNMRNMGNVWITRNKKS